MNANEENRQVGTDTHAAYISRRPAWADRVTIGSEAIDYAWTAPTWPESIEPDGETCPVEVIITREDMLYVNDEGVVLDPGPERIFLLDTNLDVENARLLAQAILECCDRINSTLAVDQ
ncbi:hypothetical protein GCM10010531_27750 [Blastococcus jejuensis]|uniref:Immunity protein 53 n=1 Tax=Blastococcus jejuensis TaxID=351224 RepID=A0ABP6P9V1_9ACTN